MIESRGDRRVIITGIGVVAPCGVGAAFFWRGLECAPAVGSTRPVTGFTPEVYGLSRVQARRLDRFAQFALGASAQALVDGGLLPDGAAAGELAGVDPARCGVLIGSGIGGAQSWERQVQTLREQGIRRVSPLLVPMVMPNAAAAAVSMRWALTGPCEAISTACATGTQAIGNAARWIAAGRVDVALAGGAEAALTETSLAGFGNMRALSPSGVCRPFDPDRDGFCASEGAGVVLLEEAGRAAERGVRGYAEVVGYGSTADAFHLTAPAPYARGALSAMELALADAGVEATDVTHVNAHGTGTELNDAAEAHAISQLLPVRPVVTSIKGVTGHSLGAAGAIEAVAVALTYRHEVVPPTIGTRKLDPELDIDLALAPRRWPAGPALSTSFGFGGHNATLVFQPVV